MTEIKKANIANDPRFKKIKEYQARIRIREGLPHLYGWKWFPWAKRFFDSTNRQCLLTAANQCSKSSSLIRKNVDWATRPKLWTQLGWRMHPVTQFWYFYPSSQTATAEFETKWQQFLPKNEFEKHPIFGWKADFRQKAIHAVQFNTSLRIYFKSYTQKETNLQASTVHKMSLDEECPEPKYNELSARLNATRGHLASVFTATLGQDFWRRAMEPTDQEILEGKEALPHAFKQTVSLYDCLKYADGTNSHWTIEDIKQIEDSCITHSEVLRRVYGRFIRDAAGLKFPTFDMKKHCLSSGPISHDWEIYAAVDVGSGGENHPAAIVFIAVSPDRTKGRVFKAWRGDGVITSAGDIFKKFLAMKKEIGRPITMQWYDFGSKDFDIISTDAGEPFTKAEKSHERGEQIVNTVFKFGMLTIDRDDPELNKLAIELSTLAKEGSKNKKKDDLADAMRYCAVGIPWDFSKVVLLGEQVTPEEHDANAEAETQRTDRWGNLLVIRSPEFESGSRIDQDLRELDELLDF